MSVLGQCEIGNWSAAGAVLSMVCAGCGDSNPECVALTSQAIYGASAVAELPPAVRHSVVGLVLRARLEGLADTAEAHTVTAECSGVSVSPTAVLTAGHCLGGSIAWEIELYSDRSRRTPDGSPCVPDTDVVPGRLVAVHPTLDLAVVSHGSNPFGQARLYDGELKTGQAGRIGGYGRDESGGSGVLAVAETRIDEVGPTTIAVDSGDDAGTCVGDSGGPLFVADQAGVWTLAGILSNGSATCTGADEFVRLGAVADWIAEQALLR
jgi:hypothetical protein